MCDVIYEKNLKYTRYTLYSCTTCSSWMCWCIIEKKVPKIPAVTKTLHFIIISQTLPAFPKVCIPQNFNNLQWKLWRILFLITSKYPSPHVYVDRFYLSLNELIKPFLPLARPSERKELPLEASWWVSEIEKILTTLPPSSLNLPRQQLTSEPSALLSDRLLLTQGFIFGPSQVVRFLPFSSLHQNQDRLKSVGALVSQGCGPPKVGRRIAFCSQTQHQIFEKCFVW